MIHVCFCLHDKTGRYAKFTGTVMLSLFDNTTADVTVHILHDNTMIQDNREKFIYLAGRYNQRVNFYNVEELCADKIAEMMLLVPEVKTSRVSIGAFYKLLIPQVISLDIEKIIYLDADIIVNLDINELWKIELGENFLAAVSESMMGEENLNAKKICIDGHVKFEDYFNSGVMIINLNLWRKERELIMRGVKLRGKHPEYVQLDQSILNYCFSARSVKLPTKFNRMTYINRAQETNIGRKIYHYAAGYSLGLNQNDILNRLWMSYFMKTPFFDESAIGRLYGGFEQIHADLKNQLRNISAAVSGKTRAFFTLPHNVEATKEIFFVRDDEDIILAENQASLQRLIDAMKLSQGKKIFFILLPNFPFAALIQAGFVYGKDFLNGLDFLSTEHGLPLNSYRLIQAM